MKTPLREHYSGCLIGQCLGDALGCPLEGLDAPFCMNALNELNLRGIVAWRSSQSLPPGQYTDDSQLARELLRSLLAQNGFDAKDYSARLVDLFLSDKVVGQGMATHNAVMRLSRNIPWEASGAPAPSAGNGTAMRAGPVGLFYYNDPDKLCEVAHLQGYGTHQDPRCSAGSIAIAGAVALALTMEEIEPVAFCNQLAAWMEPYDKGFSGYIRMLPNCLHSSFDTCVEKLLAIDRTGDMTSHWPGVSPYVVTSVCWSLFAFLLNPEDYWKAVQMAIVIGGDVDTTGAMTGAIAGARVGLDRIPEDFARMVNDQNEWGYSELKELADQVFDRLHPGQA